MKIKIINSIYDPVHIIRGNVGDIIDVDDARVEALADAGVVEIVKPKKEIEEK